MQEYRATPPAQAENRQGSIALLRLVIARHPYASMVFFVVYWLALLLALGRVLAPLYFTLHLPYLLYDVLSEITVALVVAVPLIVLKWWSEAGFTRGINGRGLLICLLPLLFVAGPPALGISGLIGYASIPIVIYAVALSLLVGFAEEGMFRGVLLRVLLPEGIWPAVIVSSLCFACIHLTNLLSGASPAYVGAQLILAFGSGILFAALRLRTGSIWPGIVLHMARDVVGLAYFGVNPHVIQMPPNTGAFVIDALFAIVYITIALVLLRPRQLRKLEITYGLAQEPAPAFPTPNPLAPYPGYAPSQLPPTPYPTYGSQSQPFPAPGNQPLPPPNTPPNQPYTSPAAYGERPAAESIVHEAGNDGKKEDDDVM